MDSNGWASDGTRFGPPIWADLSAAFPGVVFFPEHREYGAYAGASAYNGDQPLQILETETIPRQLWSQSFTNTISVAGWASNTSYGTATNILDTNLHVQQGTNSGTSGMSTPIWNNQIGNSCTGAGSPPCATTDGTQTWKDIGSLVTGVTTGDTLLCDCWFSWSGVTNTSAVFTSASTINGSLKITDSNSGKNINIDAKPAAAGNYPYYQDVYFASTRNGLAASTTHCLKQGSVSCYQSGTLQSSATLNLSGLGFMQIRYYDFTGVLRFSGVASTLVIP